MQYDIQRTVYTPQCEKESQEPIRTWARHMATILVITTMIALPVIVAISFFAGV